MTKKQKTKVVVDSNFWREIGKDYDSGLKGFAEKNSLNKSTVLAIGILDSFNQDSTKIAYLDDKEDLTKFKFSGSKIRKLFFQYRNYLLLTIVIGLFLGLFIFGLTTNLSKIVIGESNIRLNKNIPAFHKILESDLDIPYSISGKFLTGRYLLISLPKGSTVSESQLLSRELSHQMSNRVIMIIAVRSENLSKEIISGSKIGLIFSPTKISSDKSVTSNNVILLGKEKNDKYITLTVAIKKCDYQNIKNILAVSNIYLIKKSN